jgi:MFS family permease
MPFFENTGLDPNVERGPLWGAFATLFEQLERFIVLNVAWSGQAIPLILALMFPDWWLGIRILLMLYSGLALAAATGTAYGLVSAAVDHETLSVDVARDYFAKLALPGILTLAPLYGLFGLLIGLTGWIGGNPSLFILDILIRLLLLITLACSMYWGPLLAESPSASFITVGRRSLRLVWRDPGRTLLVMGVVGIALIIGAISIGGLFLVVPVVVALLQTHMVLTVRR